MQPFYCYLTYKNKYTLAQRFAYKKINFTAPIAYIWMFFQNLMYSQVGL